ncbi:hypothetical protein LAZ67_1002639 [Cordylochernes scorpioides]|uniref:Reverse transcriptase/retrotransposon-derived protein RNase H-like domain-containing protein n=1 Tax=Cordylochernes scorpioides TaxID=51811 RepID=A0ABY6JXA7_9ARAC|nr:hypothetical protein LAZ67_1002639 [Cordylochernes scorpioides]
MPDHHQIKKKLMSFLGLLNYYEKFLINKATVVEPLHRPLDSNNPWKWNRENQRAFKEAKILISSESVLAHFDVKVDKSEKTTFLPIHAFIASDETEYILSEKYIKLSIREKNSNIISESHRLIYPRSISSTM